MDKNKIINFAKSQGFGAVKKLEDWHDYEIYEPLFNDDEIHFIGLPFFIMVKDDGIRMSTLDEVEEWINEQSDEDE